MNLCIISESRSAENPESFIKAHKDLLDGNVHFLYGGTLPKYSEKYGPLEKYPTLWQRISARLGTKRFDTPLVAGLKHYLKSEKIDVVLAEYGTTGAQVFPVCRELGIPLVVHFHGRDAFEDIVIDYHRELYPSMFEHASAIVAVSEKMKEQLISLGACPTKTFVSPYGPHSHFLNISANYKSNNILAVGRFVDKKAPYYTIFAFNKICKDFPEIKLQMVGGGYLLNACQNLVKVLKLEDKVIFHDKVRHELLTSYFSDACLFVQHSIRPNNKDAEGTPVAILEAMAAGLPVIATRHMGIMDVVQEGETGFLVDEHDVDSMSKKMKYLLENRDILRQMGIASKQRIARYFLMQHHIDKLNQIIKSCVR